MMLHPGPKVSAVTGAGNYPICATISPSQRQKSSLAQYDDRGLSQFFLRKSHFEEITQTKKKCDM